MTNDREALKLTGFNGWEFLWRLNQILMPLGIAWSIWVTSAIFELKSNQLTMVESKNSAELKIKEWTRDNFIPISLSSEIREIKENIRKVDDKVTGLTIEMKNVQIDSLKSKGGN